MSLFATSLRIFLLIIVTLTLTISLGGYLINTWAQDAVYDQKHWQQTTDIIWEDSTWQQRVKDKAQRKITAGDKVERAIEKNLPDKQKPLAPYIANVVEKELETQLEDVFDHDQVKKQWDKATVELHRQVVMELQEDPEGISQAKQLRVDLRPFATALVEDTSVERFTENIDQLPQKYTTVSPLKSEKISWILTFAGYLNKYHDLFLWAMLLSILLLIVFNRIWLIGIALIINGFAISQIQERIYTYTTSNLPLTASSRVIQIWWQDDRNQLTDMNLFIWGSIVICIGLVLHMGWKIIRSRSSS